MFYGDSTIVCKSYYGYTAFHNYFDGLFVAVGSAHELALTIAYFLHTTPPIHA